MVAWLVWVGELTEEELLRRSSGWAKGQNKYGKERGKWETAPEGDQGQSCTASPVWFAQILGLSPRLTWQQPGGDPAKMTSWSCHGHRARRRYGGQPVTLPAVAAYSTGTPGGGLDEHTLFLSQSSAAG